ncbi:NADP-dependent oxidoreductase [Corynebacterium macclintockiae]|uniref:NADP-dependent oxidoreductase n=2 Tax=Corynebacterium macclintockiae TaxID=2913501 RepID=UPI003EC099EA
MGLMRIFGFESFGGPEVTRFLDVPDLQWQPGSVLIRPTAISLNPGDIKVRNGQRQGAFPVEFPMAMGREAAGIVVEADPSTGFSPGDHVFGSAFSGTGAASDSFVLLDATSTATIPSGVEATDAACLPAAAGTAYDALAELHDLETWPEEGARLLVIGAGGGVGTHALQLARHYNIEVIGIASARKKMLVERLGARFMDTAELGKTGSHVTVPPVDGILDLVGGKVLEGLAHLAPEGAIRSAADKQLATRLGGSGITRIRTEERFAELARLVAESAMRPVIGRELPFSAAAEGYKEAESGHALGKVVLTVND